MTKNIKHIAIVRTAMKEYSSMSLESAEAILDVLSNHYDKVELVEVNSQADLDALIDLKPDLVFLGLKYIVDSGQKIWITSSLGSADIPFTGSAKIAHYLERNKDLAKNEVLGAGLKTSPFLLVKIGHTLIESKLKLNFPLFVKPANKGGGVGIDGTSRVNNFEQLSFKIRDISSRYKSDALIEEFLPGREFSVAVLRRQASSEYDVMPIELIAPKDETGLQVLSNKVKSTNSEVVIEVCDEDLYDRINQLALSSFEALGAKDYGRIDIRLDENGDANFLEANLLPSLISGYGSFPKASILNNDLSHEQIIVRIVELAAETDIYEPDIIDLIELPISGADRIILA
jgi:D-alanine-D-alanine ligase